LPGARSFFPDQFTKPPDQTSGRNRKDHCAVSLTPEIAGNQEPAPPDATVVVVIEGPAVAKARPRMTRHTYTWRGHTYTPRSTAEFEARVGWAAKIAMRGRQPLWGPLRAVVRFELPIPASWSAEERAKAIVGERMPTGPADVDNYLKAVFDGMNGIVFGDDAQIVELSARKIYSVDPKTVANVIPINPNVEGREQ
jgi:Holliday junction resolvase RusA-like endonuclease